MPMFVYLASFGFIGSLFMFRWALSNDGRRSSPAARRNLGVVEQGRRREQPASHRGLSRTLDRIPLVGSGDTLQRRIAVSGLPWRNTSVRLFRLGALCFGFLLGALLGVATKSTLVFLIAIAVAALVAVLPDYLIAKRSQSRQAQLEETLPDILDRLKISLEAGRGFDSALANVINGRSGPAYDEFTRVLQDLQLGVPRDEALQAMSDRTTVTDLRIVLAAILQSSKYGLPLVEVLRIQTEELRDKRWQRAQERAIKMPVKILFPVIFCIMPTFFVVMVGPSVLRLARTL